MATIYLNEQIEQKRKAEERLSLVKELEKGKPLHKIKVMNGHILTTNPEKWENYKPFNVNYSG